MNTNVQSKVVCVKMLLLGASALKMESAYLSETFKITAVRSQVSCRFIVLYRQGQFKNYQEAGQK
jgi:hypothetical protein